MSNSLVLPTVSAGERRRRRAVGGAVLLALAATLVFGFWKLQADDATKESLIGQGVTHLDRAIAQGDEAAWDDAHEAFRRAAGHNILDAYPVFCLATLDRLRSLHAKPDQNPPVDGADTHAVSVKVVSGDYPGARDALFALSVRVTPANRTHMDYYIRLVTELEVAAARRTGR